MQIYPQKGLDNVGKKFGAIAPEKGKSKKTFDSAATLFKQGDTQKAAKTILNYLLPGPSSKSTTSSRVKKLLTQPFNQLPKDQQSLVMSLTEFALGVTGEQTKTDLGELKQHLVKQGELQPKMISYKLQEQESSSSLKMTMFMIGKAENTLDNTPGITANDISYYFNVSVPQKDLVDCPPTLPKDPYTIVSQTLEGSVVDETHVPTQDPEGTDRRDTKKSLTTLSSFKRVSKQGLREIQKKQESAAITSKSIQKFKEDTGLKSLLQTRKLDPKYTQSFSSLDFNIVGTHVFGQISKEGPVPQYIRNSFTQLQNPILKPIYDIIQQTRTKTNLQTQLLGMIATQMNAYNK